MTAIRTAAGGLVARIHKLETMRRPDGRPLAIVLTNDLDEPAGYLRDSDRKAFTRRPGESKEDLICRAINAPSNATVDVFAPF